MRRRQYPVCASCGGTINPLLYDGCEKYYLTDDGPVCSACFLEQEKHWMENNLDEHAALVGVTVVPVE